MASPSPSSPPTPSPAVPFVIWELPDSLLFHIASFVVPEPYRASMLLTKIATLCKPSYRSLILQNNNETTTTSSRTTTTTLWDLILAEDYGIIVHSNSITSTKTTYLKSFILS